MDGVRWIWLLLCKLFFYMLYRFISFSNLWRIRASFMAPSINVRKFMKSTHSSDLNPHLHSVIPNADPSVGNFIYSLYCLKTDHIVYLMLCSIRCQVKYLCVVVFAQLRTYRKVSLYLAGFG